MILQTNEIFDSYLFVQSLGIDWTTWSLILIYTGYIIATIVFIFIIGFICFIIIDE